MAGANGKKKKQPSDEYLAFESLTRKLVAVPKAEFRDKPATKTNGAARKKRTAPDNSRKTS